MVAKKMEIIVIEDVGDFEYGQFARFMDNTDDIILVNPKSIRDSIFDFDDDAEYNKSDYDFDKASAEIEWE